MSQPAPWTIYTDGAARGNPGPAAFAFVIERPGDSPVEEAGCLGNTTNNIAEYMGLIRALERAQRLGGRHLAIHSDSELIVKQMRGEYKVKHPGLLPLYEQARGLARTFDSVNLHHVRREQNKRADELCNEALDGPSRGAASSAVARPAAARRAKGKPMDEAKVAAIRDQAVDCLRSAASAWARGNTKDAPPEAVWDQLWDILRQEGVVT